MDNLTTTLDILVNDDISAQTYDIIQKIANNTSVGTTPQLSEFTSSGTWSLPSIKPKFIYVLMVGGGGSGSARRTSGYGSAGGWGGGINERLLTDVASDITVTIWSGGTRPTTNDAMGNDGGDTVISYTATDGTTKTITAYGGKGGQWQWTGSGGTGGSGDYNGWNGADGKLNNGESGWVGKFWLGNGGGGGSDFNGTWKAGGSGNAGSINYANAVANTGNGGGWAGYGTDSAALAGNGASGYCKIIYWN